MKIQILSPDKVIPYARNPRVNEHAIDKVAASLKEFGWKQPIVVDKDMVIIVGHVRHQAAKRLEMEQVPVVIAEDLTPEQVKAYRIADNRVGEESQWDDEFLALEFSELDTAEFNTDVLGFDETEIDKIQSALDQAAAEIEDGYSGDDDQELDVLLANDYRNKISDNVKRSIVKKLAEGTILGDSPVGYLNKKRYDMKTEAVEVNVDPERGPLVKQIFEEYATGMFSMAEIRLMITNAGLRSKKGFKISVSQVENILKNTFYYGYTNYKGKGILTKHIHPRLITKELFDECQRVRTGRRKTGYKRTQKPFVLKGFLKCIHCGCSYSPELKKKKYVYLRPTKSQGECKVCFPMTEQQILSQIEDVLKRMVIPKHIMLEIHEELKVSSDKEYTHQLKERKRLKAALEAVCERIKRARDLLLDLSITKQDYDEIKTDLEVERHNIEVKLQTLSTADNSFNDTIGTIFELASKSHELFKSSDIEEKRRIISILFPNLKMDAENLKFSLRKPFDMLVDCQDHPNWLGYLDEIRTYFMNNTPLFCTA